MVCIDASLIGAWFLSEDLSEKALRLRQRLPAAGEQMIAPTLLVPEATDLFRKAVYGKRIEPEVGEQAFGLFRALPITLQQAAPLAEAAWTWAKDVNAPRVFDLYYLALAERERCDLWTADGRFVRLIGHHSQRVRFVGDAAIEP